MVARISAKLSDFACQYSRNVSCKFYWNSWYDATDITVWTLKFTFSSEHEVACWKYSRITNKTLHNFRSTIITFQWWISAAHFMFKQGVQKVHQLKQQTISLLWNDTIALSMNWQMQIIPYRQ